MIIYLDTNVILSYFDIRDHFHLQNRTLLKQVDITFVTGFITIIEYESVISRLWRVNQIQFDEEILEMINNLPEHVQVRSITETCLNLLNLTILPVSGLEKIKLTNEEYLVENSFSIAYELGTHLSLRTLDTIQIASALKIKHYTNFNVEYFLTNDKNILNNAKDIRKTTQIIPLSSKELSSILKL